MDVTPELLTAAGVVGAAALALFGALVGHFMSARTARRAQDVTAGGLALDMARETRAELVEVKAEMRQVRAESDARHAQYGLAHRHASQLHHEWPGDAIPFRPAWPGELAPPI